jgi:hypothetical protein
MPTLPAPYGLAALERHVLVAVAALVVHGAGVDVDLLLGFCGAAVVAAVLLGGHFGERFAKMGARARVWDGGCVCGMWVGFFVWGVGSVCRGREINCEDKADGNLGLAARREWRLRSTCVIDSGPCEAAAGALSHGDLGRAALD